MTVTWKRGNELSAEALYALLSLRVDVFVVEQECAYHETDGRDLLPTTWHGWVEDARGVSAAVRLLTDESRARIGRVVTRPDARGQGLAATLVEQAHDRTDGVSVLDAQTYLVDWYVSLGWVSAGESFVEDGIDHTPMIRGLVAMSD